MNRAALPIPLLALLLLGLNACKDQEPEAPLADLDPERLSPLVAYVPADTPYLLANLEAAPEDVNERFWELTADARALLQERLVETRAELEASEPESTEERLLLGVLQEFDGKLDREGLEALGFDGRFIAIHADPSLPVLPVLRLSLSDGAALTAALERMAAGAGLALEAERHRELPYYFISDAGDGPGVLLAIRPDQLAATITIPADAAADLPSLETRLDWLLGLERPQTDARGRIAALNARYGLGNFFTGQLQLPELFDRALALAEQAGVAPEPLAADACQREIRELLGMVPEIVTGYETLTPAQIEQRTVLALRPDLAEGLAGATYPMPGLDPEGAGLLSFAFAIDLMALRGFLLAEISTLAQRDWQCPQLARTRPQLEQATAALQQPIPPFVTNFRGVRTVLDDVEMGSAGPVGGTGLAAVAFDNPEMLLGLAQAFAPQIAELNLAAGEPPRRLPAELLPPGMQDVFIAMVDSGFGFGVGAGTEQRLGDFLAARAPGGENRTLLRMAYDLGRVNALQRQMLAGMDLGESEEADEIQELAEDLDQALQTYYEAIGTVGLEVQASPRGIELLARTAFN